MATIIPLVVIVGPTASGKTQLALDIAEHYDGEIIAADSRTVYRGLDIGTAKPTQQEQERIPHHLIDVVEPDAIFTLWDFQQLAKKAITDIRGRDKMPILVGGTGLYTDSIIFDYDIAEAKVDKELRHRLTDASIEELHLMIKEQHIEMPENKQNKRHLVRVLEQKKINKNRRINLTPHTIIVGIATDKNVLEDRIRTRAASMFESGVVAEARTTADTYGWDTPAMSGNIYPLCRSILGGSMTLKQAVERFVVLDRRLAKRQMTWLKRNQYIQWQSLDTAYDHIAQCLGEYDRHRR